MSGDIVKMDFGACSRKISPALAFAALILAAQPAVGADASAGKLASIDQVDEVSSCYADESNNSKTNRESISCQWFVYRSEGKKVGGFIARPSASPATRRPVVIFNRGGTGAFGRVDISMLQTFVFPLVRAGFVVIGSQYRGGDPSLPVPESADQRGGDDIRDVIALFGIIDELPFADGGRVGAMGGSRGGMMAFLLARHSSRLKAVAVSGTPTDLSMGLQLRPELEQVYRKHIPGYEKNKKKALAERSVVRWVRDLPADLPILIQHGQYDRRVGVEHALKLASRLQKAGRGYKLIIHELDDHNFPRNFENFMRESIAWFEEFL